MCSALADITFIINRGCHTLCILMNCSSNSFKEKFPSRVEAETHKFEALWKFADHKNGGEMLFLTQIIINNLSPLAGYKLMSGHLAFGLRSYLLYSTSHLFQHSVLHSHWSRLNEARLSLVESVAMPLSPMP